MEFNKAYLSANNPKEWDKLYHEAKDLVWGQKPVGFLEDFLLDSALGLGPSSRILDAGSGEGRNLEALLSLKEQGQVIACDFSIYALNKSSFRLKDRVQHIACDMRYLPFEDESFEFILVSDVIETLVEPEFILREFSRILTKRGKLLCNIPDLNDGISSVEMTPIGLNRFLYRGRYFYQFLEIKPST